MDQEITRLLKLEQIPGFIMSEQEQKTLKEWKKTQKKADLSKLEEKQTVPEGYEAQDIGYENHPTLKVKNVVKNKQIN